MGGDAEYQMELEAEAAAEAKMFRESQIDQPSRPLYCWTDGELDYIWDWEPATRVLDVFSTLHAETGLGRTVFLGIDIPSESELDGGLSPYLAASAGDAIYEVVVLSHDDEAVLEAAQSDLGAPGRSARDRVIADMLGEMARFIEAQPNRDAFVFARTL